VVRAGKTEEYHKITMRLKHLQLTDAFADSQTA
jgi:hypothetical protein